MSNYIETDHVEWCKAQFRMLAEGGTWIVPRSGLVFQRQHDELVQIMVMPYLPEMEGEITPEQLIEQQAGEFETIREHFAKAGIVVRK
jgi:hypothetical protein